MKNLDLRKIVATIDFLIHKLFDLQKDFLRPNVQFLKFRFRFLKERKIFEDVKKIRTFDNFRAISENKSNF